MKLRAWYVVFGKSPHCPDPASLLAGLQPKVAGLTLDFPSEMPWTKGRLWFPTELISRYSSTEASPSILVSRHVDDLDEMLARTIEWVSANPQCGLPSDRDFILNHLRHSKQAIVLMAVSISRLARMARVCEQICGHLCRTIDGLIQVHQEGLFNPEGESIFPRNAVHRLKTT